MIRIVLRFEVDGTDFGGITTGVHNITFTLERDTYGSGQTLAVLDNVTKQMDLNVFTKPGGLTVTATVSKDQGKDIITLTPSRAADIYYTIDGTMPTAESTKYTGPVTLTSTTLVYRAEDSNG